MDIASYGEGRALNSIGASTLEKSLVEGSIDAGLSKLQGDTTAALALPVALWCTRTYMQRARALPNDFGTQAFTKRTRAHVVLLFQPPCFCTSCDRPTTVLWAACRWQPCRGLRAGHGRGWSAVRDRGAGCTVGQGARRHGHRGRRPGRLRCFPGGVAGSFAPGWWHCLLVGPLFVDVVVVIVVVVVVVVVVLVVTVIVYVAVARCRGAHSTALRTWRGAWA
jgi:hypothetical protein